MAFSGDILIHESLWEKAATHARGSRPYDFRPLLAPVRRLISSVDVAICHLETPLLADDSEPSSYPVFETPHELAPAIAWAGYDGCSTASNHSLDAGSEGVEATLHWLDAAGLDHAGTARTAREARGITYYRFKGTRIAHLSYAFGFNGFEPDAPWRANRISVPRILGDAARAEKSGADLVVVSLHWGLEYTRTPTVWQRSLADRLTRSGLIDLIIGHHAHVVQPVDRMHGTWVAYGLGNLLSGMTGTLGTPAVADGVVMVATAERKGSRWRVTDLSFAPTWVEYGSWRVLPVAQTLRRSSLPDELEPTLRSSWRRTVDAVDLDGAERDLDVRPLVPVPPAG